VSTRFTSSIEEGLFESLVCSLPESTSAAYLLVDFDNADNSHCDGAGVEP
jgi:hypothetical protein